jgi:predicted CopG family antitoxin
MIIQLERKTAEKIKKLKITERESYDSIINRLLNEREKNVQNRA